MAAELTLAAALALVAPATPEDPDAVAAIADRERLIADLLALQQRVRAGELVPLTELALGEPTREELLADIDVTEAMRLGLEPTDIRDRLLPGFAAELDQLAEARTGRAADANQPSSPLFVLLLDFETELRNVADRRRQALGLRSPLESGALANGLQPVGAAGPATIDGIDVSAAARKNAAAESLRALHPELVAAALYRAGRFAEALASWERIPASGAWTPEMKHQRADALMRTGKHDEAITEFEGLVAAHPDDRWGQQAQFSLQVARTLVALERSRQVSGDGK